MKVCLKVGDVMRRMVVGLLANEGVDHQDILLLSHALVSQSLPLLTQRDRYAHRRTHTHTHRDTHTHTHTHRGEHTRAHLHTHHAYAHIFRYTQEHEVKVDLTKDAQSSMQAV